MRLGSDAGDAEWEAFRQVVAGDLRKPDWSVSGDGDQEEEKRAREGLAKELAGKRAWVGDLVEQQRRMWEEATRKEVAWRDSLEERRQLLRVCMRSWREAHGDGVRAGAAKWEQRWAAVEARGGGDCALAARLVFPKDEQGGDSALWLYEEEGWPVRVMLAWMRLVRAGSVEQQRRGSVAWRASEEERRSRVAVLEWDGAMPGDRCAVFAHAREVEIASERGVTSGAAAIVARREQQQRQQRRQQRNTPPQSQQQPAKRQRGRTVYAAASAAAAPHAPVVAAGAHADGEGHVLAMSVDGGQEPVQCAECDVNALADTRRMRRTDAVLALREGARENFERQLCAHTPARRCAHSIVYGRPRASRTQEAR